MSSVGFNTNAAGTSRNQKTRKMKKAIFGLLALTVISFSACVRGEDGMPGPQGPPGNANVDYMIYDLSVWNYASPSFFVTLNDPQITYDIVDKGAVLVYMYAGNDQWSQLPQTFYPTSTYSETWKQFISPGQVEIDVTASDLIQPNNPGHCTFKVVTIAYRSMLQNKNVDFSNFEAVKKAFNLKDKDVTVVKR